MLANTPFAYTIFSYESLRLLIFVNVDGSQRFEPLYGMFTSYLRTITSNRGVFTTNFHGLLQNSTDNYAMFKTYYELFANYNEYVTELRDS